MEPIVATVQAVLPGKDGEYAVTTSREVIGSITFSLKDEIWDEEDFPEPGEQVVLSQLRRYQSGWRAFSARYFALGDESLLAQTH